MPGKTILVLATLDSKGEAVQVLCKRIRELGHEPMTLDLSIMNPPPFEPSISSSDVAIAGGGTAADVRGETGERHKRLEIVTKGALRIVGKLVNERRVDGIIGVGGLSNATMVSTICKSLPIGIPKVILSCSAGMGKYNLIGRSDIAVLSTVFDTDFDNLFLRQSIYQAAHMICGAVESDSISIVAEIEELHRSGRQVIAISQFLSAVCTRRLIDILRERGYATLVFHSNGVGDMVMEDLIGAGAQFDVVVDMCVAGVSERLMGGNRAADSNRLEAAGRRGIPQIVLPTALDYISCGPLSRRDEGDALWRKRQLHERRYWVEDSNRVQAKVSADEADKIGRVVAAKLNQAKAPVKFLVPLQGCDTPNRVGEALYQPEINKCLIKSLTASADPDVVEISEYDLYLDTPEFAAIIADTIQDLATTIEA
jgi:uncharacterized protein (UPF0261 family)